MNPRWPWLLVADCSAHEAELHLASPWPFGAIGGQCTKKNRVLFCTFESKYTMIFCRNMSWYTKNLRITFSENRLFSDFLPTQDMPPPLIQTNHRISLGLLHFAILRTSSNSNCMLADIFSIQSKRVFCLLFQQLPLWKMDGTPQREIMQHVTCLFSSSHMNARTIVRIAPCGKYQTFFLTTTTWRKHQKV